MEHEKFIALKTITRAWDLDDTFIHDLKEYGFVEIRTAENEEVIDLAAVEDVERVIRLHRELHVNLEGIDIIRHLLSRLHEMESEIRRLRSVR